MGTSSNSTPPTMETIPVASTLRWSLILLAMVVSAMVIARLLFPVGKVRVWSRYEGGNTGPFSARQAPPNGRPRLQVDEVADYASYFSGQQQLLNHYRWVDRNAGVVRIPIEQAMKRIL